MFQIIHGDCLAVMASLADHSIDLILCDLPYGTTGCAWDCPIDLNALWAHYKRIIKPNHAIVLTASQPFTTTLAASNLASLRYEWIWIKNRPTNFAHAKNKPMKAHENVLVFSEGSTGHASQSKNRMPYYPQDLVDLADAGHVFTKKPSELTDAFFQARPSHGGFVREKTGYPRSLLYFPTDQLGLHPTAKPVDLMKYLIQTYSLKGDVVLDNCCGSGTTGIACAETQRRFVGIEQDSKYYRMSHERIVRAFSDADIFTQP